MKIFQQKSIMGIISMCFIAWAVIFIYRSSFIAIDGKRYFCLFDDAMVSMRYAWNFAQGFGLVWNPGEYIQGYTNLLMVLLMSLVNFIFNKSTAVLVMQIIGVVLMLLNAYVSTLIADHLVENEPSQKQIFLKILVFFCVLSYYPLVYWSLMGMETGLLTLFLLLGVLSSFDYVRYGKTKFLFNMSVFLGMAYLTRNDSLIFAFLVWLYVIWKILELNNFQRHSSHFIGATILYVLFVSGQSVFQFLYYGEWLPNTYTLKLVGMPILTRLKNGYRFVTPFLEGITLLFLVSFIDMIFNFRKKKVLLLSIFTSAIALPNLCRWRSMDLLAHNVPISSTALYSVRICYICCRKNNVRNRGF